MSRAFRAVLFSALLVMPALPALLEAQSGSRGTQYALLVACSRYYEKAEFKSLPYTGNDIETFRQALVATGFDNDHIFVLHDDRPDGHDRPTRQYILEKLELVLSGMKPQDTLVVALSGHGLQYKGDPVSYFVPLDGKLSKKETLVPLSGAGGLYEKLKQCKAKRKLLLVNACRNDPTVSLDFAATKAELVDEDRPGEVPDGIAALYSCSAGQKSYYDEKRKLAIFFDHLSRAWKGEYSKDEPVTIDTLFSLVIDKTKTDAIRSYNRGQIPYPMREFQGEWVICKAPAAAPKDSGKQKVETSNVPVPDPGTNKPLPTEEVKKNPPAAPTWSPEIVPLNEALVARVLGRLNAPFKRVSETGGSLYKFTLAGMPLQLTYYKSGDLMVDARFGKADLGVLNHFNRNSKFVRAVSYGHNTPGQRTSLESNLDGADGVSEEMLAHFLTAFVVQAKAFGTFLSGGATAPAAPPASPTAAPVTARVEPFTPALLEQVLRELGLPVNRRNLSDRVVYDFGVGGMSLQLTNFGTDLMIDTRLQEAGIAVLNRYNLQNRYTRAVAYNNGGGRYTALEANLDCADGVTREMLRHFLTAFARDARQFADFLGKSGG